MLCYTFQQLASATWNRIAQSRTAQFQLKEETFTDINMLEIKLRHPAQVQTKVFTKWAEGINGADWEWWFHYPPMDWIGLRVQAKIINLVSDQFDMLHYIRAGSALAQTDKLIDHALRHRPPLMPLYCFYIETADSTALTTWTCGTYPRRRELWGCSIASAFDIKSLHARNARHLKDLMGFLQPWHCLVCCSAYGGPSRIHQMDNFIRSRFLSTTGDRQLPTKLPDSFYTQKPPDYVRAIFGDATNDNIVAPDEELQGVMIYTFSDEESFAKPGK